MTTLTPSAIARLSNTALADEIGSLTAQIKVLDDVLSALKDEAKSRGKDRIDGNLFYLTIGKSIAATLDTKAVKAEYGDKWYDDHCKLTEKTTLLVKPQAAALTAISK